MEGWKTKFLSFAGRNVLAQSILTSIPLYSMKATLLPINLCNNIDRLVRQFLWHCSNDKKKDSLSKLVIREKELGGLGIKRMHDMNLAFMAKLSWRLLQEKESL